MLTAALSSLMIDKHNQQIYLYLTLKIDNKQYRIFKFAIFFYLMQRPQSGIKEDT